jgi:hypothetical protein
VRQPRRAGYLLALDGGSDEGVPALREALLELLQRTSSNRGSLLSAKSSVSPQFFSRPSAPISRSVRPFDPEITIDLQG